MGFKPTGGPAFTVEGLAALGVKRISLGAALSRVALGAVWRAAREVKEQGTFGFAAEAPSFAEATALVTPR